MIKVLDGYVNYYTLENRNFNCTVSEFLSGNGIFLDAPCGGHGNCGKCKVYVKGDVSPVSGNEKKHLQNTELKTGMRLACLAVLTGPSAEIRIPQYRRITAVTDSLEPAIELAPWGKELGLAVDIGTTTVAAYLYDLKTGKRLGVSAVKNPQCVFGADVVSRQEQSLSGGGEQLSAAITGAVNDLADSLCRDSGRDPSEIDAGVITGNTTMLYLLHGYPVKDIAVAPFDAKHLFGDFEPAAPRFSNWAPSCRIYYPRCISAYVGADITSAILASGMCRQESPTLLADIGTNGELAINAGGKLLCCATAAGPSFEGSGIQMGSNAFDGAIDKVWIENGRTKIHTINNAEAGSICGSGLLDSIACLLDLEVIDETGRMDPDRCDEVLLDSYYLGDSKVLVCQADVRALQLAKAAIRGGIETLLYHCGLDHGTQPNLIIAGGFGSKLDPKSAQRIGLIPAGMAQSARSIGNAAGLGAVMLLLSKNAIEECEKIAAKAKVVELSTDPVFTDSFI